MSAPAAGPPGAGAAAVAAPTSGARAPRRARGDHGQLAGAEVIPIGLLVLLVGALLAANVWAVADARLAVGVAAREAARAYVEAPTEHDAIARGVAAGRAALEGLGRDATRASITFGHAGDRPWARCARAVTTASYVVPLVALPWIGGHGDGVTVEARHSELVDPYRGGLDGEARCDG